MPGQDQKKENQEMTLDELYHYLKNTQSTSESFRKYLDGMTALYAEMKELYTPDKQGLPPLMDAARIKSLREKYLDAANAVEGYMGEFSHDTSLSKKTRALVKNINRIMSRDMSALLQYENRIAQEKEPVLESLPTIIERARTYTIDLSEAKISITGSAMSQRMPLELTLNGQKLRGMFTKKNRLSFNDDYAKMIEDAQTHCTNEKAKAVLGKLTAAFRDYHPKMPEDLRSKFPLSDDPTERDVDAYRLSALIRSLELSSEGKGKALLTNILGNAMGLTSKSEINKAFGKGVIGTMTDKLSNMRGRHFTHSSSGIAQNSRLDDRNAAMSKVAGLLGVPEIICSAVPMCFKDKDGKIIEGTFMEMADGVDPAHPDGLSGWVDQETAFAESPLVVRDLANLQMLDYICGNTDRHGGNMIFSFDDGNPPRVTGVKGIDNDLSFGRKTHENGMSHLAPLNQMRAVSESMAQRIEAMSPEQLKFALREFSLSEAELDAAAARLGLVKNMLTASREKYKDKKPIEKSGTQNFIDGVVRIVPDKDFGKLRIADLCSTNRTSLLDKVKKIGKAIENVFDKAVRNIGRIFDNMRTSNPELAPLAKVTSATRATKESAEAQHKAANHFAARMDKLIGKDPDQETKDLANSVKRYQSYQAELADRLKLDPKDPNNCFEAIIGANDLFRMKQLLGEMSQSADAFLGRKDLPENDMTKLAREIRQFSDKLTNLPPEIEEEERQTVMANDRQAMELFNRSMVKQVNAVKPNDAANPNGGAAAPS